MSVDQAPDQQCSVMVGESPLVGQTPADQLVDQAPDQQRPVMVG